MEKWLNFLRLLSGAAVLLVLISGCGGGNKSEPKAEVIATEPADGGKIAIGSTLTIDFDNPPKSVSVNEKDATVNGKVATWIADGLTEGEVILDIVWTNKDNSDGSGKTISLTAFPPPPAKLSKTIPADGGKIVISEPLIKLEFSEPIASATVNGLPANLDDGAITATWDAEKYSVELIEGEEKAFIIAWKNQDDSDGEGKTITLKVAPAPASFVSSEPAFGERIMTDGTLTITFDHPLVSVSVNETLATLDDELKVATWVADNLSSGKTKFTIEWLNKDDSFGEHVVDLTVDAVPTIVVENSSVAHDDISVDPNGLNLNGIKIEFSEPINVDEAVIAIGIEASVKELGFQVYWNDSDTIATIKMYQGHLIKTQETYVITLSNITDLTGNHLAGENKITFTTKAKA